MAEKVKIVIDDREYEVEKGKTVLQVALENGIDISLLLLSPQALYSGCLQDVCSLLGEHQPSRYLLQHTGSGWDED
ncbi:MAG: 2Fe-2S iron-sulfur cluster-binding protein [Aquificota bacterium]|nr:2Fe-2S iron-sulfur cluster-binding protein [Aquificota bacterium]